VSHKLNFTFVVREPADGQWGVIKAGVWNGLIRWSSSACWQCDCTAPHCRQVMDKEVMLGAAAFTVSHERMQVPPGGRSVGTAGQVVNFTVPIDVQPYTFMYRSARPPLLSLPRRPAEISRAGLFFAGSLSKQDRPLHPALRAGLQ
jgi:hypothetical protein